MGKLKSFIKKAVAQKKMGSKGGSEGLTGLKAGVVPQGQQAPKRRAPGPSLGAPQTPMGGGERR